jgi:hypothetical protein
MSASMTDETYPYLAQLLGAYFHQDCYDDGADDAAILADFVATNHDYDVLGTRADIERFIHRHGDNALKALEEMFQPSVSLGDSDDEVRERLSAFSSALRGSSR